MGAPANGEGDGVAGPSVDLDSLAAGHQHDTGAIRLVGQVRDDDAVHGHIEVVEDGRQQVVRERSLGLDALQLHGDRLGFPAADPDGQIALVVGLAQDDHVLRRQHVDTHALDDHLTHPRGMA